MKKQTQRVNLNLEVDTLEVIDAFAKLNGRTRTHVIESFIKPALPALRELLSMPDKLTAMSDAQRLLALSKLDTLEQKTTNIARAIPQHVKGVTDNTPV